MGVDPLDVRILRDFTQRRATSPLDSQFRKSFADIARGLGVDADTVRNRVRKLQRSRLVGESHIVVNPRLMGGNDVAIWFDIEPAAKDKLMNELKLIEGVFIITSFLGPRIMVFVRSRGERFLERQLELIRRISGTRHLDFATVPYPECTMNLSKTDWTVLKALQKAPRKLYSTIAKEAGLATRTVKRRIDRMIQGGVAFALPAIDPKALQGAMMAALEVTYPTDRKSELDGKIAKLLDGFVWHVLHLLPQQPDHMQPCFFSLILSNMWQAKEILRQVEQLPGIRSTRIDFYEDMTFLFEFFDEYMAGKQGQLPLT